VIGRDTSAGARVVTDAFRRAGRRGMLAAVRSLSLPRQDLAPSLAGIDRPTMFVVGDDDAMWTVAAARTAVARLPHGALTVVPGGGHVAPLLRSPQRLVDAVTAFWHDPALT